MNQWELQKALKFEKPTLVGMRGCPGSGKSTAARKLLAANAERAVIHSTDNYYIGEDGVYRFDQSRALEFHRRNQEAAFYDMCEGKHIVIVDNTNIFADHFYPYYEFAKWLDYAVLVMEPTNPWAFDLKELTRRNTHEVPEETIEDMLKRYEPHKVFMARLEELWLLNERKRAEAKLQDTTIG